MVDRLFTEPGLAALYDRFSPWQPRGDLGFYLPLVLDAESVLDVGCGTGQLLRLARERGHAGRLVGLDPAAAMLDQARARADVEWVLGDLDSLPATEPFELVVMTGHAFQVLVHDEEVRAAFVAIRSLLAGHGHFVFETRNPGARAWEQWTPAHASVVASPDGATVRMAHDVVGPFDGNTVTFTTTFSSPAWDREEVSHSTLRFLTAPALASLLTEAGYVVDAQYGDWDRSPLGDRSPEIITMASLVRV